MLDLQIRVPNLLCKIPDSDFLDRTKKNHERLQTISSQQLK